MNSSFGVPKENYDADDHSGIIKHKQVFGQKLNYQASLLDERAMFKRGRIAKEHLPVKHSDASVVQPLAQMLSYFFLRLISMDPE
jgi:hypothetical protein